MKSKTEAVMVCVTNSQSPYHGMRGTVELEEWTREQDFWVNVKIGSTEMLMAKKYLLLN